MSPRRTEPPKHPAPWTPAVLEVVGRIISVEQARLGKRTMKVLDPFAGIGRIHDLPFQTTGVELEKEWANQHPDTEVGDATKLRFRPNSFDVVATSPCYGNRMADHHNAQDGSHRRSYKHYLGRDLSEGSSGVMLWFDDHRGDPYRELHVASWREAIRVSRNLVIVNCKNHRRTIKRGEGPQLQRVTEWHMQTLVELGCTIDQVRRVEVHGYRFGENADIREAFESIIVARVP